MLPGLPYRGGIVKRTITGFGGLDRSGGGGNGRIADMTNLCSDSAPLLSTRPPRYTVGFVGAPNGIFCAGRLFVADGESLYADGERLGTVENSEKRFCALGERVIVFPDKLIYENGALLPLEARYEATGLVFGDGSYAGESAENNSITTRGDPFPFRAGDAVTISGCAEKGNNKTSVIREISADGKTLRFYENTFTSATEAGAVALSRRVPDLDYICANENRVWGCKGDTIWCCKLGDPYNWNVFDGLNTDAWSVETGTAGKFTACCAYLGYPCFFKEDRIFKVYGSKPSNFQAMGAPTLGVIPGADKTLAVAGETLFYLSRAGVTSYAGGIPAPAGAALGETRFTGGAAGSDGLKYYLSTLDVDGNCSLLVYDTQRGLWHREDDLKVLGTAYRDGLYALTADSLLLLGRPASIPAGSTPEAAVRSSVTFGDFDWNSFSGKYPTRLWLRAESDAALTVEIAYDGGGWERVCEWTPGGTGSGYFPVPIRRCDRYRLRLSAPGPWKLRALETEYYDGSASRRP